MVEVIGGLIGVMKLWIGYDLKKREAQEKGEPEPEKPEQADEGQQVAETVATAVEQYGDANDKRALENFQAEPDDELYAQKFKQILAALAKNNPAFAQQLQQMVKQDNVGNLVITTTINMHDNAKMGASIGEFSGGTINNTF